MAMYKMGTMYKMGNNPLKGCTCRIGIFLSAKTIYLFPTRCCGSPCGRQWRRHASATTATEAGKSKPKTNTAEESGSFAMNLFRGQIAADQVFPYPEGTCPS